MCRVWNMWRRGPVVRDFAAIVGFAATYYFIAFSLGLRLFLGSPSWEECYVGAVFQVSEGRRLRSGALGQEMDRIAHISPSLVTSADQPRS